MVKNNINNMDSKTLIKPAEEASITKEQFDELGDDKLTKFLADFWDIFPGHETHALRFFKAGTLPIGKLTITQMKLFLSKSMSVSKLSTIEDVNLWTEVKEEINKRLI